MELNSNQTGASTPTKEGRPELLTSENRFCTLLSINNAIISILNMQDLFHAIAKALKENFPVDCTAVTLYNKEKDVFEVFSIEPFSSSVELYTGFEMLRQDSHCGWVFDRNKPLIVKDTAKVQKFATDHILLDQGLRSYIVLPLETTGKVIGTFNIGNAAPNRFKEADVEFASLVAKQLALAIDNAQKHEEIRKLKERLEKENTYLQEEIKRQHNFEEIISESKSFKEVLSNVEQVAVTDATVLILGETGTGKELIARALHVISPRKERPLVKVNCAALAANLIESELLGHEKGAFTGALSRKIGRFELADKGTLFLDEIGDMPLDVQAKVLRVLQEGEFERIGGVQTIKVDVRVIAATNRDLERAIEKGLFREDLYYRLNVFPIKLPPLRERPGDIELLVNHFVKKYGKKHGKEIKKIPGKVINTLQSYSFPGNIRQLENIIERAIITTEGEILQLDDSLEMLTGTGANAPGNGTLAEVERNHILSVLKETGWRIQGKLGAAERLGLNPGTLRSRMKKLGVKRPQLSI